MPMMFGFSRQRKQLLRAELERFLDDARTFGALRMYVVGALSRDEAGPETELELVILQVTDEPFHRRADFWVTHLRPRIGTRFLVYTPEEFEALEESDSLLIEAQRSGVMVVG